jgi:UDP-N-acetylmuramoyl-tripeptide--D-alanyl-D-alanine ligase
MKELFKKVVVAVLTWEAKAILARHKPYIIGVTGNLGKTSTKDAIYTVLKDHVHVRRSKKSMNSEFGVPLTILGESSGWNNPLKWALILLRGLFVPFDKEYPTHLVLEIGADRPGDIKNITSWVKPDISVVTQFGKVPVHIEFFADRNAVIEEKGYLVNSLKETGIFIYNKDCLDSTSLISKTKARTIGFGIHEKADIEAHNVKLYGQPLSGTEADIVYGEEKVQLVLPEVVGKSPVYCSLPALVVARELGISLTDACKALEVGEKPKGRMRLLPGMSGSTIIDDSYNASPKAAEHGLKTLGEIDTKGRKIAVLGDMMELGLHTRDEHYKIGKIAGSICHKLFAVGIRSRATVEGALDEKMSEAHIFECDSSIEAGKELVGSLQEGDVVYVKGSQSMRMERAIEMILARTHDPKAYLVRQEEEWMKRS